MKNRLVAVIIVMLHAGGVAFSQIPVEVFTGDKKATLDLMFFKYIKNKEGRQSPILFFNRNRASIDYAMTKTTHLPMFGFTEALSYNHAKWKGFAPVLVLSLLNKGMYPKAGVQLAKVKKDYTIFTWLVSEMMNQPNVDFFFLGRYTPKLSHTIHLFSQIEFIQAIPTSRQNDLAFTQRFRLGLKIKEVQLGAGLDLSELGRQNFTQTNNIGGFLRYEF